MLLFKILETSRDPNIRANIVIGIGDLAVSFATIIDERLNDLYMGLRADDLIVKKNTLMVLTHLILNGMIKVKGQLAEMAKCTEDTQVRVSDLAKLFFHELSTKDNAIYNNLSDSTCLSAALWWLITDMLSSDLAPVNGQVRRVRRGLPEHDALHLWLHRERASS